jgi:hypothetical protein
MACTNCSQTTSLTSPCASGCASTINTDCVIYDQEPLCFEDVNIEDGDKRTLTALLQQIQCGLTKGSKFIKFHTDGETDDGSAYTVVAEDTTKVLLITLTDEGIVGTVTNTITLPQTADFIDKEIIFKDISSPIDTNVTTLVYQFNIQIQSDWDPLTTTNVFYTLADPTHKTLKLRFVKTSEVSYQWIVCP